MCYSLQAIRITTESTNETGTDGALVSGMEFTLYKIQVETNTVKIYVNANRTLAVVFPPYGRLYKVRSDVNALDLAVNMLFHETVNDISYNTISYGSYLNSLEATVSIELKDVA